MDRKRENNLIRRWETIRGIRQFFQEEGFVEIETPLLVSSPGMEPHLSALEVDCTLPNGTRRSKYLHTSPEYAMKKLLGEGWEKIFQICRVFRDEELGPTHQIEFTMLEWYRAHADYREIMVDCERLLGSLTEKILDRQDLSYQGKNLTFTPPFERITVARAMSLYGGCDIVLNRDADSLLAAARAQGYIFDPRETYSFDDVFFKVFLESVEKRLGSPKPTILYDYPSTMAALARLKPDNPLWAERFELYIAGLEMANAFSELNDPVEQRNRFENDQRLRAELGKPVYAIDEELLQALSRMPPSAGIALGVDRLVMLLSDAASIEEVLAFPFQA
ncbi:MAG: EF-P lysine aminoacylase EpmA [Deltaproteobacteria bacterium]|nr:EF-P lysine aminoacylase EpmA [Deltaproteobacteria bacterium]